MGENLQGTITAFNTYHTDAYMIAVKNGFEGTEAEWLASLKGDKGDTGEQGIQGVQGYTPVRGVDYWTDADKAELVKEVETTAIGDIETTLDELHAYAQALVAGGNAE